MIAQPSLCRTWSENPKTGFLTTRLIYFTHVISIMCKIKESFHLTLRAMRWLSGRVSDSGARGRGLETYLRCVASLSKTLYSLKVLVIPRKRWLRPDITEKLLTGTLSLNTNKQNLTLVCIGCIERHKILWIGLLYCEQGHFLSFFLLILSRSILMIISGVVGG